MKKLNIPSPTVEITSALLNDKKLRLFIKRDELIHPDISGNKWRKLAAYLPHIKQHNIKHIISFGGAYSNHLHALAALCADLNIKLTAIIRGEASTPLSPTLKACKNLNCQFVFVNRLEYKQRNDADYLKRIALMDKDALIIQEGGYGELGIVGIKDCITEINAQLTSQFDCQFSHIISGVGSGTTLAGICQNLSTKQQAIGVCAIKNGSYLEDEIQALISDKEKTTQFDLWTDYHFGGFAKVNDDLLEFIEGIYQDQQILLDPIYTGKALFALFDRIKEGYFKENSKLVFLHTGGLQGWQGMLQRGLVSDAYLRSMNVNLNKR